VQDNKQTAISFYFSHSHPKLRVLRARRSNLFKIFSTAATPVNILQNIFSIPMRVERQNPER
jgi:hypothetical protein